MTCLVHSTRMPSRCAGGVLVRALIVVAATTIPVPAAATRPPLAVHTCPNGLQVAVAENHATPLVSVELAVHDGAMVESPAFNGLSHLYEHQFFRGNEAIPDALAFEARMRALGMNRGATTEVESVSYFFTTTSDHFPDSLTFARDAALRPRFDPIELQHQKAEVTAEIDRDGSDPLGHIQRPVNARVWWKYPTYKAAIDQRASVVGATLEKMRSIWAHYYVPNNALLVVVGDVHADEVFRQADVLFAKWPRGADPFVAEPLVTHPPIRRSEVVVVRQPVENVSFRVFWQGPSAVGDAATDTHAGAVLAHLLLSRGSTFQKSLVDSKACIRSELAFRSQRNAGELELTFEATPDGARECVRTVFAELLKLRAPGYFSDEQIRGAILQAEVEGAHDRETTIRYAHAITVGWATAGLDDYAAYDERLERVTRAAVTRFIDRWLTGRPFVFGALTPLASGLQQAQLEADAGIRGTR